MKRDCFNVREATSDECLKILSEPQLLSTLPIDSVSELPKYIRTHKHLFYISTFRSYKLIFFFFERDTCQDIYEIHIACPRNSIIASRALVLTAARWILKHGTIGAKALITACPEGKIANMCRRLGGVELRREEDKIHFMFSLATVNNLI